MIPAPAEGPAVALVLAAGAGRRFGGAKQLLPWGPRPLVRHVARVALASSVEEVIVVVGAARRAVSRAVAGLPLEVVVNPDWCLGMGSSIAAGVAAVPAEAQLAVVLLADQPKVSPGLVDRCLAVQRASGAPAVLCHDGAVAGPPAVFAAQLFPELLLLEPASGGRAVVERWGQAVQYVPVSPWEVADIDTPLDYLRLGWGTVRRCLGRGEE